MENNLIWIALIVIYLLLIVNTGVFITTIYLKLRKKFLRFQHKQKEEELTPFLNQYLKGIEEHKNKLMYDGKTIKTQTMINLLQNNEQLKKSTTAKVYDSLGYVEGLINESKKNLSLELIHQLSEMNSIKVFSRLMDGTMNDDYEIRYQSFYALSFLPMNYNQIKEYTNALLSSNILRDRIIEMINNLSLNPEIYFSLLQKEDSTLGKVVLLRVLEDKLEQGTDVMKKKVTNYLINPEYDCNTETLVI